jgi:hypothetical protein
MLADLVSNVRARARRETVTGGKRKITIARFCITDAGQLIKD